MPFVPSHVQLELLESCVIYRPARRRFGHSSRLCCGDAEKLSVKPLMLLTLTGRCRRLLSCNCSARGSIWMPPFVGC